MMPRKQWVPYERLNAADVNTNLADQSVMVFATTTARDAALPSPTVGMQSAVTASPDLGAPRYWNGTAWTLITNSASYPNPWPLGDASQTASMSAWQFASSTSWQQVTASFGQDVVVHGVAYSSDTTPNPAEVGIATGAAGSEVERWRTWTQPISIDRGTYHPVPYGIGVTNGTRLAVKSYTSSGTRMTITVYYTPITAAPALADFGVVAVVGMTGTAWAEVGAAPPAPFASSGCWIVGFQGRSRAITSTEVKMRIGFGASGSEVAASGYFSDPNNHTTTAGPLTTSLISPIWWAPGTRLAVQTDNAGATATNHTFGPILRGSLL